MITLTNDEKFTASFVFYYSFADMISKIPDREIRLQAYEMLFEYAMFGTEPQIEHWAVDMVFSAIKPQIDANNKRRKNGQKGGQKTTQEKAAQAQAHLAVQAQQAEAARAQAEEAAAQAQAEAAAQAQAEAAAQAQAEAAARAQAEAAAQAEAEAQAEAAARAQAHPAVQAQQAAAAQAQAEARAQAAAAAQAQAEAAAQAQAHPAVQAQQAAAAQVQVETAAQAAAAQAQPAVQAEQIVQFGAKKYPTTPAELARFEQFAYKLFEKYHDGSKPNLSDIERVMERSYTRVQRPDGQAVAIFDRDKADLLEYAFEQAKGADKLNWRYLEGMYRNFAARNIVTGAEALQYEMQRAQRFV